jgi:Domain of unknown function (DUF1844)
MAEVQTSAASGEMTQRFVEFVMMHAQNAALFLGQIPNPQTGQAEVNLELAKMFIDQLAMIQEKTRGNLSSEESIVLRNALSNLQMAYVEVAQGKGAPFPPADVTPPTEEDAPKEAAEVKPSQAGLDPGAAEAETHKKFTKSYGA